MRLKNPAVSRLPTEHGVRKKSGKNKRENQGGVCVQEKIRVFRYSGQIVTRAVWLVETPATTLPLIQRKNNENIWFFLSKGK
jgi:hypothetical protein